MTHWLTVFLYELRQQVRRKSYLILTFGLPVLIIAGFSVYQAYRDTQDDGEDQPAAPITEEIQDANQVIGLVDLTPEGLFPPPESYEGTPGMCDPATATALTPGVIKRLTSPYCMQNMVRGFPSFDAGKTALEDDEIDALYVVEPDYVETGTLSAYMTGFSLEAANTDQLAENYILASLLQNTDADTYQTMYLRLRDPAVIQEHRLDQEATTTEPENENQNFVLVYAFGIILTMSIFWGGGYVMQSVVQEKESRIVEIVLSSVRPLPLLVGKITAMGLLSLIQVATLMGTFIYVGGQLGTIFEQLGDIEVRPVALAVMVVYFVLGYLFYGTLMAAIGAVSATARESQNFVTVVTLPAALPFFVLSIFAEEPNGTLAKVFSMIPVTAPLSMVMRMSITDVPVGQLALSLALMVLGLLAAFWLAARLFRVNTLLMGNTPKLRDLPKLIRG